MKRRIRWIALGVLVLVIGGTVAAVALRGRGPAAEIEVAAIDRRTLSAAISASGDLEAVGQRDVSPQVSGTIEDLPVQDGQKVRAGQLLVRIDSSPLRVAASQAWAAYEAAQAQRAQLLQSAPRQAEIEAAQQAVDQTYYVYKRAKYKYKKANIYAKADLKIAMDQALTAHLQAEAALEKLLAASNLGVQLRSANAAIDSAYRAYRKARVDVSSAVMYSPTGGTLIFKSQMDPQTGAETKVSEGGAVTIGMPIFTVANLAKTQFIADVDETDISKVKSGQKATITLDSYPDAVFSGKVTQVAASAVTAKSGGTSFPVKIRMPRTKVALRIGMNGSADIVRAQARDVLVVPYEAVFSKAGDSYVFVIEADTARRKKVKLGLSTDTYYEVKSGLSEGQKVARTKATSLKDGQAVTMK